jgi:hypothetical protein
MGLRVIRYRNLVDREDCLIGKRIAYRGEERRGETRKERVDGVDQFLLLNEQ